MEPKPSEQYDVSVWRCAACGMMLGDVVSSNGIRRLTLYRNDGITASVLAIVTGSAEITCPHCRAVRIWYAPEEGLREFLDRELSRRGIGAHSIDNS